MVKSNKLAGFTLTFFLIFAGCSSTGRSTTIPEPETGISQADLQRAVTAAEGFDPSMYAEEPPVVDAVLEHQVPATLLSGEASAGAYVSGGYRIQVQFARDKATADQTVENVIAWWNKMKGRYRETTLFDGLAPVQNVYRQPYFRIRLGNFGTKEEAEEMLEIVRNEFPGAFVVSDGAN